jgi:DNA invertase Pin-like site-specific DNA recombinase
MARVGYTRVSTIDQNLGLQLDGIDVDKVFADKVSRKNTHRPALDELLDYVRDGDTVLVHSMDWVARDLDDLRHLVRTLTGRGVRVEFLKEHLTFAGDDSPMATLMLSIMGSFAELETGITV